MKIKITSDSTCDLSAELLNRFDITVLPLTVTLGDNSGLDGVDITPDDIYAYVNASGNLPKTSAVSVGEYLDFFQPFLDEGYEVIHFNLSAEFSSTHANALIAAQELEGKVHVVDSRNLSTGQGHAVLVAAEMAANGATPQEIVEKMADLVTKIEASFVLDQLEYLHKGGRCSSVAMLGANLLKLKPCIEVADGKMGVGKKYRGSYAASLQNYVADRLTGRDDIDYKRIFVTHTKCDEQMVQDVICQVKEICPQFEEVLETTAGCTITTHCGPNTLGILFIRK